MPQVTKEQFYAQVGLNQLDKEEEEIAQDLLEAYQAALKKEKTRKRVRTPEQAKKHKNEQRARAKAKDPVAYKQKKKEQRERYRAKKKREEEVAKQEHWRNLAELVMLTED